MLHSRTEVDHCDSRIDRSNVGMISFRPDICVLLAFRGAEGSLRRDKRKLYANRHRVGQCNAGHDPQPRDQQS